MLKIVIGGITVAKTAVAMPIKPAVRQPTSMAAFTAIAPGQDWDRAIISSISFSSSQWSSSENFFFIKVTITKPPPNVKALI